MGARPPDQQDSWGRPVILSNLIGARVRSCGASVGYVADLRVSAGDEILAVVGVIVAPRVRSSFLGYERATMRGPWLINSVLRFLNRGTFLVAWEDIDDIDDGARVLTLSPHYCRRDVALLGSAV